MSDHDDLRSGKPKTEAGLEGSGDGGGTQISSCWTTRRERLLRGFDAEAWKARAMSSVLKESLRGRRGASEGWGRVEVMLTDVFVLCVCGVGRSCCSWMMSLNLRKQVEESTGYYVGRVAK
jgi:hypothetical protein